MKQKNNFFVKQTAKNIKINSVEIFKIKLLINYKLLVYYCKKKKDFFDEWKRK